MEKMDKAIKIGFIAVIIIMCILPLAGMAVFGPSDAVANEAAAPAPELRDGLGFNFALLSDTKSFVAGRFFGRPELITAERRLSTLLTGVTGSEEVVAGRDGWLFFGETLDEYTGTDRLSERELFAAAKNLSLMAEYCAGEGMDFLFTLAPDKNSLYPEYMPQTGVRAEDRDSGRLYGLLEGAGVEYLDLFELLGDRDEVLYFAHDSHWTSRGAALAADGLNRALGRESGYFDGEFEPRPHSGDLYGMLYPAGTDGETGPEPVDMPKFTYGEGGTRPDSIVINTESGGEGALLCYRDSFGNDLYPYLAASYASARFSRSPVYDMTLASQLDADTVIVELVERNLDYLIEYPPVLPAPRRDVTLPEDVRGELRVYSENVEPEGTALISGTLPERPDDSSPVYVSNGQAVYEAALTGDGFEIRLPASHGPWTLAFYADGEMAAYRAV